MNRRTRAIAFILLAIAAALGAAGVADRYGSSVARGYGPLRPVVVLGEDLPAGDRLGQREVTDALTIRRVPARFVPLGALASPAEALGLAPATALSGGSYLLASQLQVPTRGRSGPDRLRGGRGPVEIAVSGADALALAEPGPRTRVDVVVTSEPTSSGPGRTYVAAEGVPLLALRTGLEGPGPGATAAATLGLTRGQALRLIAAQSFARRVTLLAAVLR
jgi:Flp pilus assembly protein CpaB